MKEKISAQAQHLRRYKQQNSVQAEQTAQNGLKKLLQNPKTEDRCKKRIQYRIN